MLKENFKVAVPEFPDRKTSITAYGAVKNVYDDDTGRINARVINEAIKKYVVTGRRYGSNSARSMDDITNQAFIRGSSLS